MVSYLDQSFLYKEKVTVALWGTQLLENYAQYLCGTFPEVEVEFVLAANTKDYYRYRNNHNDLPDILTVDGKELDPNAIYSVLVCSDYDWYVVDARKAAGCEDYESDDTEPNRKQTVCKPILR